MWSQIAALTVLVVSAHAHSIATSHQSRQDHYDNQHGHHVGHVVNAGHGIGHEIGHGIGHGIGHEIGHGIGHVEHKEHAWSKPNYKFSYSVKDPHTGDHKTQSEQRHGDVVKGEYALVEPDGNVRSVHYSADDHQGFIASVHHKTQHHHPQHYHHGHSAHH